MPELIPAEPGTPEWLAARRAGVTATDIVTILGLSCWDSVYSLFWRKMQQALEVEQTERMRLGRELEHYVMVRFTEDRGIVPQWPAGLWHHSERAWQMATLDGLLLAGNEPVEFKTWADADKGSWQHGPPPQVRAQVLWQMDTMQVATGHVGVVFLPSGEFRSYVIKHLDCPVHHGTPAHATGCIDCYVCTDLEVMRAAGEEFMKRLRLEFPPPDPDASMATLAAQRARFTRQPDKAVEVPWLAFDQWNLSKREADRAAEQVRKYEIELRELMGEATLVTVDGQPVARRVVSDQNVKAHTRHMDYLTRIKPKGDDSE
jgi:putative phage-type endonuclease